MKCQIPQISWHSRDPVLSIDFQPIDGNSFRLASGGTDCHVLIWFVTYNENKTIKVECASDLYRHNKSVNVVRFSPNGELLASGDDEGAMFVWQLKEREQSETSKDEEIVNKEDWYPLKLLRGHLEDIYDLSWSSDGNYMVSASMDNSAIIWDMQKYQKLHMLPDCKGYVQGVAWDPKNQFIASIGSDRSLRIYNINYKKTVYKVQKAPWHVSTEKGNFKARLFYDDTLKSYFRRLCFTPDGELLIVPSGIVDKGDKCTNTTYVFSRHIFNKPAFHLPSGDKYTVAVRCNPFLYKLRHEKSENKENKPMIDLPYRMVFAVAACDSILLYDTEQLPPFAFVSNIHYTHLTDMTWSPDGLTLVASSTDGYCSFLIFTPEELGEKYVPPVVPVVVESAKEDKPLLIEDPKSKKDAPPCKEKMETDNVSLKDNAKDSTVKDNLEAACNTPKHKEQSSVEVISVNILNPKDKASPKVTTVTPKSGKKTPKMCTIKSFFMSPKDRPIIKKSGDVAEKNKLEASNVTVCDEDNSNKISEHSSKQQGVLSEKKYLDKTVPKIEVSKGDGTKMETEEDNSNSVEIICLESNSEKQSTKSTPKCKLQLNFSDHSKDFKTEEIVSAKKEFQTECSEDAVSSFNDLEKEDSANIEMQENDWKLELSQDEEIPMDVDPQVHATSNPKSENVTSSLKPENVTCSPKPEKIDSQKQPSPTKITPKRRIPLITLTKKITTTQ
ncbi:chromatin assembly factor 1 subunit B-like [Uloborus diversus]|uniref:chromatin assembly factor 1 subunit B-like n=1 Tax=Uloborus diversus TaxID=327109 RepID=UPI00240A41B0|nr:chromatin assembly factor 1 subunit B-like [Uloborus diversus]